MKSIFTLLISCFMTAHLVLAATWWWLMPGGFPVSHARFWVNRILPLLMIALVVTYLWARWKNRSKWMRTLAAVLVAFWICASFSGRIVFTETAQLIWLVPLFGAVIIGFIAYRIDPLRRRPRADALAGLVAGALVGALVPLSQRGGDPDTRPLNLDFAADALSGNSGEEIPTNVVRLTESIRVQPNGAVVSYGLGHLHLDIEPMLTFISRSPDRCWTLLARRKDRIGPPRSLIGIRRDGQLVDLEYSDDGRSRLSVSPEAIEAISRLDSTVYSHLNTYCAIMVMGHRKLSLSFSPCPQQHIDVTSFDYPFGRPARFGFMTESGELRIVEARSAEKGPFRTIASGPLRRGEPLVITLFDQDQPVCRITFDDWSAQAGTALSPTAGWGAPVNAITFMLTGSSPTSPAYICLELAGTAIGRGYDSVGHSAGTYRNRMRVEQIAGE